MEKRRILQQQIGASEQSPGFGENGYSLYTFRSHDIQQPIWDRFFSVSPLIIVGSKESKETEGYDLAPKHMATSLGWDNYFGFVCTPRHKTYQNIQKY